MPTYGYQCTSCKHEFQVFQAMKDAPISDCPECASPVKRLLYPVGIVFKGSGWYVTDSRKPEPAEGGESPSKDVKSSDKESSSSNTAKSAGESSSPTPAASSESK